MSIENRISVTEQIINTTLIANPDGGSQSENILKSIQIGEEKYRLEEEDITLNPPIEGTEEFLTGIQDGDTIYRTYPPTAIDHVINPTNYILPFKIVNTIDQPDILTFDPQKKILTLVSWSIVTDLSGSIQISSYPTADFYTGYPLGLLIINSKGKTIAKQLAGSWKRDTSIEQITGNLYAYRYTLVGYFPDLKQDKIYRVGVCALASNADNFSNLVLSDNILYSETLGSFTYLLTT